MKKIICDICKKEIKDDSYIHQTLGSLNLYAHLSCTKGSKYIEIKRSD